MRVEAVSINQVFINARVLKIPYFQRSYVWRDTNWEQFFNDIYQIASMTEEADKEAYFLGSIILKDAGIVNGCQQLDVIDGQQRLTTIVLFMKALYLSLAKNNLFNNQFMQMSLDDDLNPILVTNHNDKAIYKKIVELELFENLHSESRLAKCFEYFSKRIKEAKEPTDGSNPVSPTALLQCVNNYVRLVCIEVQAGENAQKIFETINCAGIKLTTGELLKNYLFNENNVDYYEHSWKGVFEGLNVNYWEGEIVKGRIKGEHIENFFYRYMLIKMQEPSLKEELSSDEKKKYRQKDGIFENFRNLIEKHHLDKNDIINEIVDYANRYMNTFKADILEEGVTRHFGLERLTCLMMAQDAWTMTPYILYILKNVSDSNERSKIFGYMETYLIRRIICKSKNNNYSDMFSENLIGQQVKTYDDFKAYVNDSSKRGALLMPSDDDVQKALFENDLKRDALTILYMLESRINDNFTNDSTYSNGFSSFTSETLLPEKDSNGWPFASGHDEESRNVLAKTLGNIILLRDKLKGKDKKATWLTKRDAMKPKADNLIISSVVTRDLAAYDEKSIEKRNNWLVEQINKTWKI